MQKRFIIILAAALSCFATLQAKVQLPHLIADNMVVQQQTDVRLWG